MNLFCPNLGKNEFSWKKKLRQFFDIPIIYYRAKNQKKLMTLPEKNTELTDRQTDKPNRQTDGQTDRQTDRQTYNGDFIGPSVGRGSNDTVDQKVHVLI